MSDDIVLGRRKLWIVALLAAVVFTVLGTPQAAWAHNALVSTSPGDGMTVVKPPSSIVLTFNEPAIKTGTKVLVTGPDGSVTAGDPQLVDTTVEQDLLPELSAGEYTVEWRVTSADGHPINGEFSFKVRTGSVGTSAPTPVPTTEATGSPSPVAPSPTAAVSQTATVSQTAAVSQTATVSDQPTVATPAADPAGPAQSPRSGWWWLLAVVPIGLAVALGWRFNRRP